VIPLIVITIVKSIIPPNSPHWAKVFGIERYEMPKKSLTVTKKSWRSDGVLDGFSLFINKSAFYSISNSKYYGISFDFPCYFINSLLDPLLFELSSGRAETKLRFISLDVFIGISLLLYQE
jgi:hypothetical protein